MNGTINLIASRTVPLPSGAEPLVRILCLHLHFRLTSGNFGLWLVLNKQSISSFEVKLKGRGCGGVRRCYPIFLLNYEQKKQKFPGLCSVCDEDILKSVALKSLCRPIGALWGF